MFKGKIVLVTGGSRGIGRAISLRFAQLGATILINFLQNINVAEETQRLIKNLGKKCMLYQSNLNNPEEISQMMSKIADDFAHLSIENFSINSFSPKIC